MTEAGLERAVKPEIEAAYRRCMAIARGHYENFPVASWLLPRRLRRPVAVIYAFARHADDLADEGQMSPQQRLDLLDAYGAGLDAAMAGAAVENPVLLATADVVGRHALPAALLHDLLTAFRMDVAKPVYAHAHDVLQYCRYSANPVGRLLLHLVDQATPDNLRHSDAVCSALQLLNFLQDLDQDYRENGRIYLPRDEMERFGVTERHFRDRITDDAMRGLIRHQIGHTRQLLTAGAPLGRALRGPLGFEVRMIMAAGLRVLERLAAQDGDVFARPRLSSLDRLGLIWGAARRR